MKRRKRIVMSVICGLLVAAVALGGTLAYLTDSESITNTFTVGTGYEGNDAFTLDETKKPDAGLPTETSTINRTENNQTYSGLLPGTQFAKDPTFHLGKNQDGTHVIESYIVAKLTDFDKAISEGYIFKNMLGEAGLNLNWVKVANSDGSTKSIDYRKYDGYYIFTNNGQIDNMDVAYTGDNEDDIAILGEGQSTDALFTYVQLKDMGNEEFEKVSDSLSVDISGVAVQAPYTSPSEAVAAAIDKLQ